MKTFKNIKYAASMFLAGMLVFTFNNCEEIGKAVKDTSVASSLNAVGDGEKAIYVWNTVTYEQNPIVLFANRGYFDDATLLNWSFYHDRNAFCEVVDSPEDAVKDWVEFNCDHAGKLDVVLIAHQPARGDGEPYTVERFETTIYLKEASERDELGVTSPVIYELAEIFPYGDKTPPDYNIDGGGGYDASGTGSDLDPRFLRGLQVYGERCAMCHLINGDPMGNGEDNDNAKRYFRLRRDYYEVLNNGPNDAYLNQCGINFGAISDRQDQAIAAALCRIRIGLASETAQMYDYDQVKELFAFDESRIHGTPQVDPFDFNSSKRRFIRDFVDIADAADATNNQTISTTIYETQNNARDALPDDSFIEEFSNPIPDPTPGAIPGSLTGQELTDYNNMTPAEQAAYIASRDENNDGDPDNDSTPDDDYRSGGYDLNSPNRGRDALTADKNNLSTGDNALEVEVYNFNGDGTVAGGGDSTRMYPVITDIYNEDNVDGEPEIFRIPKVDFKPEMSEDLEALIIYIVETL
ncbi:MAG: hypothetical protein CL677_03830 [Bdellovibrionaceae bacterium]|nr:hypothetical protein [Pseudobdellovibrionaceae bacterium]|tara:strand:- start:26302 stop:27870 length:1569 start_codon:yes stop_codon:yes gene_type:complete